MRPRERRETGEQDLFRSRLDQIIDLKHPLATLARTVDWGFLEGRFGEVYTDDPGHPPLPTRLMAGLVDRFIQVEGYRCTSLQPPRPSNGRFAKSRRKSRQNTWRMPVSAVSLPSFIGELPRLDTNAGVSRQKLASTTRH
jgi:hypothetical protein